MGVEVERSSVAQVTAQGAGGKRVRATRVSGGEIQVGVEDLLGKFPGPTLTAADAEAFADAMREMARSAR